MFFSRKQYHTYLKMANRQKSGILLPIDPNLPSDYRPKSPKLAYVLKKDGIAKTRPMSGNTNNTIDMIIVHIKYFLVFSTEMNIFSIISLCS